MCCASRVSHIMFLVSHGISLHHNNESLCDCEVSTQLMPTKKFVQILMTQRFVRCSNNVEWHVVVSISFFCVLCSDWAQPAGQRLAIGIVAPIFNLNSVWIRSIDRSTWTLSSCNGPHSISTWLVSFAAAATYISQFLLAEQKINQTRNWIDRN